MRRKSQNYAVLGLMDKSKNSLKYQMSQNSAAQREGCGWGDVTQNKSPKQKLAPLERVRKKEMEMVKGLISVFFWG